MNRSRRLRILMVALTLVAAHPGISSAVNDDDQDALVGTWITSVTPLGDDAPPPFPAILTFNEGGTALFSAAGPPIPALGNPGHGVWKKLGHRKYAATFVQLTFGSDLQLNGSLKLSVLITLGGNNSITTLDQATIYDLDGNEIVTLSATETGRRLKVEVIH